MTDQRSEDLDPTTAAVDDADMPIDPNQIDAPQSAPMDDAAGGPTADTDDGSTAERAPDSEEIAAEMGDFA